MRHAHAGTGMGLEAKRGDKQQQLFPASWNLDRVDQRSPVLDGLYRCLSQSTKVTCQQPTIQGISGQ